LFTRSPEHIPGETAIRYGLDARGNVKRAFSVDGAGIPRHKATPESWGNPEAVFVSLSDQAPPDSDRAILQQDGRT
jgi:hypothetical protein